MFHDEVTLTLESGKGGDGAVSFRREKYIPKGGPDGGDGGRGGDVYIAASRQLSDLNHLASVRELRAQNGTPGAGRKLDGKKGDDLRVVVPVGTRIYRQSVHAWRQIADLTQEGQEARVLSGGTGGLGNVHFATATHQTPRHAQPGEPSQRAAFRFELELIADVGIIGLPNAGKSTFLSVVSDAKPKIGDYPFTTLSPVLGVVSVYDRRYVFADIPGLIAGASEGKGLGHLFLRHVRRTRMFVHLIDSLSSDYARDYQAIRKELKQFDPSLLDKPEIVCLAKAELITPDESPDAKQKIDELTKVIQAPSRFFSHQSVSAVTKQNLSALLDEVATMLD